MDERPIDLTPLDPSLDGEAWERRIAAIAALAAPELARRAAVPESPALVLLGWFRPAFSAAAALALCAVAALALLPERQGAAVRAFTAEELRLPHSVAVLLSEERSPTMGELALAVQEGRR
jgi:hypothetical protein